MPVDTFTKSQFEAALPVDKLTGKPLWMHAGLVDGRMCGRFHVFNDETVEVDLYPVPVDVALAIARAIWETLKPGKKETDE